MERATILLQQIRDKQIAEAERSRKSQIKNVNHLFEYEFENAQIQYQRAIHEFTELGQHEIDDTEALPNPSSNRSLSKLSRLVADLEADRGTKSARKRKRPSQLGHVPFVPSLPSDNARSDLNLIKRDMELKKPPQAATSQLVVQVNEDCSELKIEDDVYSVGDEISLFSTLSQESISGLLTSINSSCFIMRTGEGAKISTRLSLISTRRVVLSREINIIERLQSILKTTTAL